MNFLFFLSACLLSITAFSLQTQNADLPLEDEHEEVSLEEKLCLEDDDEENTSSLIQQRERPQVVQIPTKKPSPK